MKLNFEAIAERVSADDVITMVLEEVEKKYHKKIMEGKPLAGSASLESTEEETVQKPTEQPTAEQAGDAAASETEGKKKTKRGFFGKK